MSKRAAARLALVATFFAAACESGAGASPEPDPAESAAGGSDPATGGEPAEVDGPGDEAPVPEEGLDLDQCTHLGFEPINASFSNEGGVFQYAALDAPGQPFDWLKVRIAESSLAGLELGESDLGGEPGGACDVCVTVEGDCSVGGGKVSCARNYAAESGTVVLESFPGTSKPLPASSSPLPVAAAPAEPTCVPEGNGVVVGANIADFQLRNCLGETVHLHDACDDGSKATWLFATAGWCSACTLVLQSIADSLGGEITKESLAASWSPHVDMKLVLFEDDTYGPPSLAYCGKYAKQHHLDPSMVLVDAGFALRGTVKDAVLRDAATGDSWCLEEFTFDGAAPVGIPLTWPQGYEVPAKGLGTTWTNINPYMTADANGMVASSTPWYAILRSTNMEYVWSSWFDESQDPIQVLNALLAE